VAESRFKSLAAVLASGRVAENRALDWLQKNHHPPYIRRAPEGFYRFFGGVGKDFELFFRFSCEDGEDLTIKFLGVRRAFLGGKRVASDAAKKGRFNWRG
jgi:hypothetical protein